MTEYVRVLARVTVTAPGYFRHGHENSGNWINTELVRRPGVKMDSKQLRHKAHKAVCTKMIHSDKQVKSAQNKLSIPNINVKQTCCLLNMIMFLM